MERTARRSLVVFALVAAGLILARAMPVGPAPAWFAIACLGCAVAGPSRGWACRVALSIACAGFAGGWWTLQAPLRGGSNLDVALGSSRAAYERRLAEVEGLVLQTPRAVEPGGSMARFVPAQPRISFELSVERVRTETGWRASRGVVRVFGDGIDVSAGERVRVLGLHAPARSPMNPGEGDLGLWAAMSRDAGTLSVPAPDLVRALPAEGLSIRSALLAGRAWLVDRARAVLGGLDSEGGALLRAVTIGVHDPEHRHVRDAFTRVGLAHLMAISGFHLALLVGLVLLAMRLSGDWGRLEAVVLVLLVLGYLIVTPARPPIVRAGLVVLAIVLSESLGRRYDRLTVLGWVGMLLLLWRPMDLFTLGFQLSLGLTGGLLWLAPKVESRLRPTRIRGLIERPDRRPSRVLLRGLGARARSAAVVTLVCWLIALPVVIHHTGIVSPMAILTTLLVTPVIVALLAIGFAGVVAGLIVPAAGKAIVGLGASLAGWLVGAVEMVDRLPMASVQLPLVSAAWASAGVLIAVAWLRLGGARRRVLGACTAGLVLWLGVEVGAARLDPGVRLRIDALSVGDGTCLLLRSGDEAMLWDCGSSRTSFGERELGRIVRELGGRRVRTILVTHPNLDHHNALADALTPLGVDRILLNEAFGLRASEQRFGAEAFILGGLQNRRIDVQTVGAGDVVEFGEVTLEMLSPPPAWRPESINDTSIVAIIRVPSARGERRALLCGDIEREAMARLLDSGAALKAHVLELPHHGSHHALAEAFVEAADPRIVLQSTGPSRLTDERWERVRQERSWLVTARDGAISVEFQRDGEIVWETLRGR